MRSNQGLADALADADERITGVIPRLRGDKLPFEERLKFADDLVALSKEFTALARDLGDAGRAVRMSLFHDGSLPPDHGI